MKGNPLLMPLALFPGLALAQAAISTDRPGFSDGSSIVGIRTWQVEAGFFNSRVGSADATSLGDVLLRHGVADGLELRLIGLSYGIAGAHREWLDPSLGFKLRLSKSATEVSLVGQSTIPVGQGILRTNRWNPTVKLAWSHPVGSQTLGGNLVVATLGTGSARFTQSAVSLWLSHPWAKSSSLVLEAWGVDRVTRGGPAGSFASLAATYLIANDTQLDLRIGTGFNQRRDGWFLQGGISYRF